MPGKAHVLCSSLSDFAPDETKLPCLILLQGYVVVGNQASPKTRKSPLRMWWFNRHFQCEFGRNNSLGM